MNVGSTRNVQRLLGLFVRSCLPIVVAGVLQARRMPLPAALVASFSLATLAGRVRRRLEVQWGTPEIPVYVGDVVQLPFSITNGSARGATGSFILNVGGDGTTSASVPIPALAPGERGDAVATLVTLRRRAAGPLPRQLLAYNRLVGGIRPVSLARETVLPAVRPVPDFPPAHVLRHRTAATGAGSATGRRGDGDPLLVRAFVSGDALSSVHWRSTARTGSPVVMEREDLGTASVVLLVAATPEQYEGDASPADEAFERAVARAAGLVQAAHAAAVPLSVLSPSGGEPPRGAGLDAVQDWLAGLGRTAPAEAGLVAEAARRAAGGVVAVVSAERRLADEVRRVATSTLVLDLAEPW